MILLIAVAVTAYLVIGFLILVLYYCQPIIEDIAGISVVLFWPVVLIIELCCGIDDAAKALANKLRK